jgi:hypothetical protein
LLAPAILNLREHLEKRDDLLGQTSHNLALLLEQVIADKARLVDDAVLRVQRELTYQMTAGRVDVKRIEQILLSEQKQLPEIDAIRITNAAGDVIFGKGVAPDAAVSYADREFFQQHQKHISEMQVITSATISDIENISTVIDQINNVIIGIVTAVEE